jgi:hypothetical protein
MPYVWCNVSETIPPWICTYGKTYTYFRGEKLREILQNGSNEEYIEGEAEEDSTESIVQVQEEADDETGASALQTEEDSEKLLFHRSLECSGGPKHLLLRNGKPV